MAGYVERMGGGKCAQRADAQKVDVNRPRGRTTMRWEDCTKRGLEGMRDECRKKENDSRI